MYGNTIISGLMKKRELIGLISNEAEDTSGRTAAEIERVIYARVTSFDFLERAAGAERQEQWSVKIAKTEENAGSGSIRVRKVTNLREPGAAVQYILTSKLDIGMKGSSAETSEQSTVDQFNVFKYLANKGMMKDRYVFNIDGSDRQWEVDCFQKPGELYFEWVKIDLEGWPSGKELPQLPFTAAEIIDGDKASQTDETKAKISRLYEEVFLMANTNEPLGSPAEQEPEGGSGQPGVAADTGAQAIEDKPDPGANKPEPEADGEGGQNTDGDDEAAKKPEGGESEGDGGKAKPDATDVVGDLGEKTTEAFSSAGQVLTQLIPILGPLVAVVQGQRSTDLGGVSTRQHTTKGSYHINADGRKSGREDKTGSFNLTDALDAKDYINLLEHAVNDVKSKKKDIDRIDMTLWPQRDGRFAIFNIKTDRDGETQIFTGNNPGKLKWFSMSLAGKRIIRLTGDEVAQFEFNGRLIRVPFDGKMVEFDVGQLRSLKYQTVPKGNAFDIVEHNFDN